MDEINNVNSFDGSQDIDFLKSKNFPAGHHFMRY